LITLKGYFLSGVTIFILLFLAKITSLMESISPWKDQRWLPGVLNKKQMIALINAHLLLGISNDEAEANIGEDASALDLHLTDEDIRC